MKSKRKFLEDPRGSKTRGLSNLSIAQPSITVKPNKYLTADGKQITSKAYYGLVTGKLKPIRVSISNTVQSFLKSNGFNNIKRHEISLGGIVHVKKQHGKNGNHLYGHREVNSSDIRKIPDIIENYDSLTKSNKLSKSGNPVIIYSKRYGNEIFYYLEYIYNGILYPQTFYVN